MRLLAFRIEHYRPVQDSGWIDVGEITAIIGKNESGKTSLLKALWKFNPYLPAPYQIDREWPRGRRRERDAHKVVATVRFGFTPEERAQLAALDESLRPLTGVEVQRTYHGDFIYHFLPRNPQHPHRVRRVLDALREQFARQPFLPMGRLRKDAEAALAALGQQEEAGSPALMVSAEGIPGDDDEARLAPTRQAVTLVHGWLPTFVYMDDHKVFNGTAQLDQLLMRRKAGRLTEEDRTVLQILAMAGLDLDAEVAKLGNPDREQRILDMNDASQALSELIADRWSQKRYEVLFQADGAHFITFVKDSDTNVLIPLEERSKGFQWFFSFDMTFMCETGGQFTNAVILLDEPGLHLHAAAQRDLLKRMRAYAAHNQLIYTTHMPFMIDFTDLDRVYIAEEMGAEGTKVHNNWKAAGDDARFTLQAALGLSWSRQLCAEPYNLIVEDAADHWILTAMSALLTDAGDEGLDPRLTITPAGGARNVAYVGAMLLGSQGRVMVLMNSLPAFDSAAAETARQWLRDDARFLAVRQVLGRAYPCAVEDLFPEAYYLEQVHMTYHQELGLTPLVLEGPQSSIVSRVARALEAAGTVRFSRNAVARQLMLDLPERTLAAFPEETVTRFRRLFALINAMARRWVDDPAGAPEPLLPLPDAPPPLAAPELSTTS